MDMLNCHDVEQVGQTIVETLTVISIEEASIKRSGLNITITWGWCSHGRKESCSQSISFAWPLYCANQVRITKVSAVCIWTYASHFLLCIKQNVPLNQHMYVPMSVLENIHNLLTGESCLKSQEFPLWVLFLHVPVNTEMYTTYLQNIVGLDEKTKYLFLSYMFKLLLLLSHDNSAPESGCSINNYLPGVHGQYSKMIA